MTEPANIEYQPQPEPVPEDKELYQGGVVDDGMLIDLGITPQGGNGDILVVPEEEPAKKEQVTPVKQNTPDIVVPEQNAPVKRNESDIIIMEEQPAPSAKKEEKKTTPDISIPVENKPEPIPVTTAKPAESAKPAVTTKPAASETKPVNTAKSATPAKKPTQPASAKKPTTVKSTGARQQRQPLIEDTGIDFNDGFGNVLRRRNDTIPSKKKVTTTDKKGDKKTEKKKIPNLEDEYYELEGF